MDPDFFLDFKEKQTDPDLFFSSTEKIYFNSIRNKTFLNILLMIGSESGQSEIQIRKSAHHGFEVCVSN